MRQKIVLAVRLVLCLPGWALGMVVWALLGSYSLWLPGIVAGLIIGVSWTIIIFRYVVEEKRQ